MEKILRELESAATILMAPPNAVSSEDRHKAEHCFIEFRKSRNPYDMCKAMLEASKNDYVLFEAVTTIKLAIIREWTLLSKELVDNICNFLLCFATEHTGLQNYVREQILQVVAIIFKLGTLEDPEARTKLITKLSHLLENGNKNMELVSCSIMKALLTEFSTTNQSTNFGMSLDFHSKCKRSFEESDLLNIFVLAVQILQKYMNSSLSTLSRQDIAIFIRYLSLAEQILHWEFMADVHWLTLAKFSLTCTLNNETAKKIIFRPPKSWKNIILNSNAIELFFKLFQMTQHHSELTHHAMQCLQQLASIAGSIFSSDEIQTKYLFDYIQNFLRISTNSGMFTQKWSSHQALGISNMLYRLVDVFPVKIMVKLPPETFSLLLDAMTYFTCSFQELALQDNDFLDGNEYSEASNQLLDAWMVLISHHEDYPPSCFTNHALKIVNTYLKTHLSPPDGIMNSVKADEIDCDVETENDRTLYEDELYNISQLGRQCLGEILPTLNAKLESRVASLKQLFILQKDGKNNIDSKDVDTLFEDLHWLVIISSYIISDDSPGESPQISTELITYMNVFLQSHPNCIKSSVMHITSIGGEQNVDIHQVDEVIRLFVNVLRIIQIEMEYLRNQGMMAFSPELASTLLWFLKRFVKGYLSFNESTCIKNCPTLMACFHSTNDCGKFVLNLFLDVAELNLCSWASEPQTSKDTVLLLLRLVEDKDRAASCLNFPTLWNISKMFSSNHTSIVSLAPKTQRQLAEALMRACDIVTDVDTKNKFRNTLLEPIITSYKQIRDKEHFSKDNATVKHLLLRTLDCITGFAPACYGASANDVFLYMRPVIEDTVNLLEIYDKDACIVVAVLQMFVVVVDEWLCTMDKVKSSSLCGICLSLIQRYCKFNLGRRILGRHEEEEQYEDLLLLIKLLSHILARDFLSFDKDSDTLDVDPNDITTQSVECVVFGLQYIIPLINEELMKYPNLSNEYFKLVTFVCEIYPEKMYKLPPDIFQTFMASIQLAITKYGGDVGKCGLEALSSMAKFYSNECDHNDSVNKPLADALKEFLNVVFGNIVLGSSDVDLIEPASVCLFMLICSCQEDYLQLANRLIAQQEINDVKFKQTLINAFQMLTPNDLQLTPNRQSLKKFRKNLEIFLGTVKGFLCYK